MTITPQPVPPDDVPAERTRTQVRYDWDAVVLGQWQRWVDLTGQDVDYADALRQCTRVRLAAKWYADHHGLTLQSRRQRKGQLLDLRFIRPDTENPAPTVHPTVGA